MSDLECAVQFTLNLYMDKAPRMSYHVDVLLDEDKAVARRRRSKRVRVSAFKSGAMTIIESKSISHSTSTPSHTHSVTHSPRLDVYRILT
jgi:hypothetical protein